MHDTTKSCTVVSKSTAADIQINNKSDVHMTPPQVALLLAKVLLIIIKFTDESNVVMTPPPIGTIASKNGSYRGY